MFLIGGTNYHINFEDNYAKDLKVYECSFSRTSDTIGKLLFGVYTLDFHNNSSDAPVYLYNNIFSDIHNNLFFNSAVWPSSWRLSDDDGNIKHGFKYLTRVIQIRDNVVQSDDVGHAHKRTIIWVI